MKTGGLPATQNREYSGLRTQKQLVGEGREDLIITSYLRRLKYDDYTSTHKHDFKLCKEVILQIISNIILHI